jgi:Uma2 family endonuclease
MAQIADRPKRTPLSALPPLENGDHLDQPTFHQRYLAMHPDFRAELVQGVVFVPSPLKMPHGEHHALVVGWLMNYRVATPGTRTSDNPTVILGEESEPQPDAILMIDPAHGGQSQINEDEYIAGPPELIVEVASSSEAYDMHEKLRDYERAGVQEYVVVLLRENAVRWFVLDGGKYRDWPVSKDGLLRSRGFPGLWLDGEALLQRDGERVLDALHRGLQDAAHALFVAELGRR